MSNLLDLAIKAHGGWKRWEEAQKISAQASIGGAMWHLKGWNSALSDVRVSVDPHKQHTEYSPFLEAGRKSVFEPDRTEIVSATNGEVLAHRDAPRQSFEGHTLTTPWDVQQLIYFSGYAIWTYLTTPFLFKLPGFAVEETDPWIENGETWRGLKVTFPPNVHSHSSEQIFYFDESGLLRRHDYSVEIMGGTLSANYASEYRDFNGLVIPTRRRVYSKGPDGSPNLERLAVSIDLHSVVVE